MTGDDGSTAGPGRLRWRLSFKYAFLVSLVTGMVLLGHGAVSAWVLWDEQRRMIAEVQMRHAAAAEAQIRAFMRDIETRLEWLVATPWLIREDEERRIDALRAMRDIPAISELTWVGPSGREVFSLSRTASDRIGSGIDRSVSPEVTGARATGTHHGHVYFVAGSEPRVRIATADRDGGVAIAEVDLKHVWDIVARIRIGHSGRAYVADGEQRLIAHPDISLVLRNTFAGDLEQVAATRDGDPGPRALMQPVADLSGTAVLAAYARIAALNWIVLVEQPTSEAYAPVVASLRLTAAILVFGLCVAIGASILLARQMTLPIRRLRDGAERIGAGALDYRIAVTAADELGDLGARFNAMAAGLQRSHATLERRVEERTKQLSEANESKSRIFAGASHDLRQPLHALRLFAGQIKSERDPARRDHLLGRLDVALVAMNERFDAFLDLSKLDAGAVECHIADFSLAHLLDRLEATFQPAAEAKGVRLYIDPCEEAVRGDVLLLERILQNLISNAIRYTENGTIRVSHVRQGERLIISVEDTGIGLSLEQQRLVFTEFWRAGGSRGLGGDGLGLGLSIVERLARLLGHEVSLSSTLGLGSVFRVSVPWVDGPARPRDLAITDRVRDIQAFGRGVRALAVDDDPLALDAMVALLEGWGFDVVQASSKQEALAAAAGHPPIGFMISDQYLDCDTGLDIVAALRRTADEPVAVLVSGDVRPDLAAAAMAMAVPLLSKPVSPMMLRGLLVSRLGRAAAR